MRFMYYFNGLGDGEFVEIATNPRRREAMITRLSQRRLIDFIFGCAVLFFSGVMLLFDRSGRTGYVAALGVLQIAIGMNRDATVKALLLHAEASLRVPSPPTTDH